MDIDIHNTTLRQRSRTLYMAAPVATSAIRTNRTNVIGCGLKLKARLNRAILGLEPDKASDLEKLIEAEFALWAQSKRLCDATGVNDFYAIQQLVFMSWLMSGDAFVLFKQGEADDMHPYSLRLHVIEADRISTPQKRSGRRNTVMLCDGIPIANFLYGVEGETDAGHIIHDGVEVDNEGAITAFHICSGYPSIMSPLQKGLEWTRIEAYGKDTGTPNILQIMDAERPDQYRGVPYLAHVIEPLLQVRRYTESELTSALIESFFTAFIKTERPPGTMPMNSIGEPDDLISTNPNDYEMGPGMINVLKPGEDVQFGDPKRPTSGFDLFVHSITEQIGAALEIPSDLLNKSFNASYSASRAALLEAWKAFKMRRDWFVSDFCRPVYEAWMNEAVAIGRIDAPGYFDDPLIRAAWLGSEWVGPSQGQLDPVKEITAELLAIQHGITTREQATVRLNGGSWDDNVEQLAKENALLLQMGSSSSITVNIEAEEAAANAQSGNAQQSGQQ